MPDAYDDYLRALDDEVARERDGRDVGPSFFTTLLDASQRATERQIRDSLPSRDQQREFAESLREPTQDEVTE